MPKIIGLTEQQSALREISAAVKKMDGINDFLNTPNPEGEIHYLLRSRRETSSD